MARKILLADDSVTAQNMGRKILADAGYEVITVNNGSAALKKITEAKPDLIVLDVYMPGYSGLEVCQRLKENPETARTPVLLTVGKLEPFKPEEARRVRAEGFIVKPFEASELLSALSKLEDKIVPRAESSKPGRFARAIAAVEESGRSGRNDAADQDSGWKNRIAFPSKKTEKSEEEDGDDPAIYNAKNRDLRTVVEHDPARTEKGAVASSESRVDVAALGAPGLPRDVSAEEIAAIAAAAAQVQASSAAHESAETKPADRTEGAAEGQAAADFEVGAPTERISAESVAAPVSADAPAATTFAEATGGKGEDHREEDAHKIRKEDRFENTGEAPAGAEVTAALASKPGNGDSSRADGPAFGAGHYMEEIPVTMAVGSAAGEQGETRWMAIPVALHPDEAAIPLELEMQKAYAALAAAEANSPGFVSSIRDAVVPALTVAALLPEVVAPAPDVVASVSSAVAERESVAPSVDAELTHSVNALAVMPEAVGGAAADFAALAASQAYTPSNFSSESGPSAAPYSPDGTSSSELSAAPHVASERDLATPQLQGQESGSGADQDIPSVAAEAAQESAVQKTHDAEPMVAKTTAAHDESAAGGTRSLADETESGLAANTAAAWATWRQIRETAQPQLAAEGRNPAERESRVDESSSQSEPAAMAVAAGAERAPEEASGADSTDSGAIASIVDSVLADLRPKIVEEISRKLGKKK